MAIMRRAFWDPVKGQERIDVQDLTTARLNVGEASIEVIEGDVVITTENGKKLSVNNLLERLEALETAYMEDKLLGSDPGKIGT